MGKQTVSRQFVPSFREMDSLLIIFKTKESIYIEEKHTGTKVCFHRWFDKEAGFYTKCWSRFSRDLKCKKYLTLYDIYVLSVKYGIAQMVVTKMPEIPEGAKMIKGRQYEK